MEVYGRQTEAQELDSYIKSDKSEFIALYGRRRIGKTYLVNQMFGDRFAFAVTGVIEGTRDEQFAVFNHALAEFGANLSDGKPDNWIDALSCLQRLLESKDDGSEQIVFIDELPCFDTKGSRFVFAFDHFWNSWASRRPNLKLIVCGSATSWMLGNIIDNHGGLHNRITHEIHLREFTLREVEEYLLGNGFKWNRHTILQLYMAVGGVPYYLSLLSPSLSLAQNMDVLFFGPDARLGREFERLYKSLFSNARMYIDVVRLLASRREGLSRDDIAAGLSVPSSGYLSQVMSDLVACDLVRFFHLRGRRGLLRQGLYQLTDFYSLFHLTFAAGRTTDPLFWQKSTGTPAVATWQGLAFERVCMSHVAQMQRALRIDAMVCNYYSWRSRHSGVQIDLIIERSDHVVNLCEMKFGRRPYAMTAKDEERVRTREAAFLDETGLRLAVHPVIVSPYGLQQNMHSCDIVRVLTTDDLF